MDAEENLVEKKYVTDGSWDLFTARVSSFVPFMFPPYQTRGGLWQSSNSNLRTFGWLGTDKNFQLSNSHDAR